MKAKPSTKKKKQPVLGTVVKQLMLLKRRQPSNISIDISLAKTLAGASL